MLAVAEGNSIVIHMQIRPVTATILAESCFERFKTDTIVLTNVSTDLRRRMIRFGEYNHVSSFVVDRQSTALESGF